MRQLIRRFGRDQRGSAIVFFAGAMAGFIVMLAMTVDVGRLYGLRQRLKIVADGAALAAARSLPDATAAQSAAEDILDRNGIAQSGATSQVSIAADGSSATISISGQVMTTFARILGMTSIGVPATSTATSAPVGRVLGLCPLGVPIQSFTYGQQVTLKSATGNQSGIPGNFGAVDLGGTGASNYQNNFAYGYGGPVSVGDYLNIETGAMTGPTQQAVNYRINQAPGETYTNFATNSPRLVYMPVLDYSKVNGNGEVPVAGFAAFFLESISGGNITGRYLRQVAPGDLNPGGPDYGLRSVKLS